MQIETLLQSRGKSASKMTEALKFIGNGKMEVGLNRIAEYFSREGEKAGIIKGVTGTLTIVAIFAGVAYLVKEAIEKNKNLKSEGEALIRDLRDGLSDDMGIPDEG